MPQGGVVTQDENYGSCFRRPHQVVCFDEISAVATGISETQCIQSN